MNKDKFEKLFELIIVTILYIIVPLFATLIDVKFGLIVCACLGYFWVMKNELERH